MNENKCPKCGYKMTLLYQFYACDRCDGLIKSSKLDYEYYLWAIVDHTDLKRLQRGDVEMINASSVCVSYEDAKSVNDFLKLVTSKNTWTHIIRATRPFYDISTDDINTTMIMHIKYFDDKFFIRKDWNLYSPSEEMYACSLEVTERDISDALSK